MAEFKLPDVGEGLTEAEIVSWKVKVGDVIEINDIIVEIETAKSLVELPSPYAGTILALMVDEGQMVDVGTPIISVGDPTRPRHLPLPLLRRPSPTPTSGWPEGRCAGRLRRSTSPTWTSPTPPPPVAARASRSSVATRPSAARSVGPAAARRPRRPPPARRPRCRCRVRSRPVAPSPRRSRRSTSRPCRPRRPAPRAEPRPPRRWCRPSAQSPSDVRALAKPPVRKLAKDLGIDLTTLIGSGAGGVITRADVEAAPRASYDPCTDCCNDVERPSRTGERETREPVKGVRKMMAQAMVGSRVLGAARHRVDHRRRDGDDGARRRG